MASEIQELRKKIDPGDMLGRVVGFPEQMEQAWKIGKEFAKGIKPVDVRQVVVCGMGGSAIGGDVARSFLGDRLNVPLYSCREYAIPKYLRDNSLVIISSYSGNTGETLSAHDTVGKSPVIAITSGGKLEERCKKSKTPCCKIPGGMPPRSALGYSLFPLLQILRAAGVATFDDAEYEEALETIRDRCVRYGPDSEDNAAWDLAEALHEGLPYIYASPGLMESVARRWACQINENSKTFAHFAIFPELNHNEIVGWQTLEGLMDGVLVVSLEDVDDHEMTRRQTEVGLEIIDELAGGVITVRGDKGGRLARLLATLILGDFASVYLAYMYEVDPTPVEKIDHLKKEIVKPRAKEEK